MLDYRLILSVWYENGEFKVKVERFKLNKGSNEIELCNIIKKLIKSWRCESGVANVEVSRLEKMFE